MEEDVNSFLDYFYVLFIFIAIFISFLQEYAKSCRSKLSIRKYQKLNAYAIRYDQPSKYHRAFSSILLLIIYHNLMCEPCSYLFQGEENQLLLIV